MVTPSTWISALFLLIFSVFCLASWPTTFKRAGRWRFELFSCDFALGALLFSTLAAYTFGNLGSELGFGDRMLVAGRTLQGLAVLAGACFALANMLFLSSVSLIGMAAAYPLTVGMGCAVVALLDWKAGNPLLLLTGTALIIVALVLAGVAIKQRAAALTANAAAATPVVPAPSKTLRTSKTQQARRWRISTKGILVGLIGGVALGVALPIIARATFNEFGLGPYAGLLLFCLGLFATTLALNVYFMNVAIHGGPISLNTYLEGNVQQHLFGIAGGAFWAAGALTLALALSVPPPNSLGVTLSFAAPPLAVLLAMFWGLVVWKEYAIASALARRLLVASAAFFVGAILLLGLGIPH